MLLMSPIRIFEVSIASIGIVNCFITAVILLFAKRGNIHANRILTILLIAVCLKLNFAIITNFKEDFGLTGIIFYLLSKAAYISFGPLLFIYFRTLLKKTTRVLLIIAMFAPALSPFMGYLFKFKLPLMVMQVYFLTFLIIIYIFLRKAYFNNEKVKYRKLEGFYVKTFFGGFTLIWFTVNFLFFTKKMYFLELALIFTVSFYIIFYLAVKHFWMNKGDDMEFPKYKNSNLSDHEGNEILLMLNKLMEDEHLYKESEITLPKIAGILKINTHKLSQVINQRMNMTFNQYINSYRINAIKKKLVSPDYKDTKIISIAFDYGFNSLTSFNSTFKKFTNYTPSQFRNNNILN